MNKTKKLQTRFLAVIISLVMCITILPLNIAKAAETLTVYVSISQGGEFVTSKDGEAVAYQKIEVTDVNGNGSYDVADVLYTAHEEFYEGGAAAGYSDYESTWGLSLGTLWGDSSGAFGYRVENGEVYVSSLETEVKDGYYVHAYVYQDQTYWSDAYAFFTSESATATTEKETTLTLNRLGYDENWNTISIAAQGASIYVNGVLQDGVTTDAEGNVKLTFDEAGTYTVIAKGTAISGDSTVPITPAYCSVVVTDEAETTEATTEGNKEENAEDNSSETTEITTEEDLDKTTKSVDEIISSEMDSCESYMNDAFGNQWSYGYEWYIYNMLRAGVALDETELNNYYSSVVDEVTKWDSTQKPTDIARVALALSAMGKDITNVGGVNLAAMLYNHPDLDAGSNELAYALLALDAKATEIPSDAKWSRDAIINALLGFQNSENGGFGLFDNKTTSVDMTSIILQALAPYKKDNTQVATAIENGVAYLKNNISANYDYENNSNSTAQVLMALAVLGIDPTVEANGFGTADNNIITRLYEYRVVDGTGYSYMIGEKANSYATIQVMQAFNAYKLYKAGGNSYWNLTNAGVNNSDTTVKQETIDSNVNTGDEAPIMAMLMLCIFSAVELIAISKKKADR